MVRIGRLGTVAPWELRDRRIITYSSRLVLLHANCVKKPHRSSTMVTFFALLAHKITSSIMTIVRGENDA